MTLLVGPGELGKPAGHGNFVGAIAKGGRRQPPERVDQAAPDASDTAEHGGEAQRAVRAIRAAFGCAA